MLVAAVIADAGNFHVYAIAKIAAAAVEAGIVMAAVPADADALALLPLGDIGAEFIDDARDFVSWNARILNAGPGTFFR